jgi:hypothetical protein
LQLAMLFCTFTPGPKNNLPPTDVRKNAGQTYAKKAFRAANALLFCRRPGLEYLLNI